MGKVTMYGSHCGVVGDYYHAADYEALEAKLNNEAALADARLQAYEIANEEHKKEVRRLCERAESCEAKLAALVEAAELKRNAIVINAEDFMQHLDGRWVAVPEEDFDQLRAAVAAAKGTP